MFFTLDSKLRYLVQKANILVHILKSTNVRTIKVSFYFQTLTNQNKKKKRKV
jgi:hypothetical protein